MRNMQSTYRILFACAIIFLLPLHYLLAGALVLTGFFIYKWYAEGVVLAALAVLFYGEAGILYWLYVGAFALIFLIVERLKERLILYQNE